MRDDTKKWRPPVSGQKPSIELKGISLRHLAPCPQTLISGPRAAALKLAGMKHAVGWPNRAEGEKYAISMRRDRILIVGEPMDPSGWLDKEGLAVSDISSGYQIISISGSRAFDVLKTGTELSMNESSASALRLWNGYSVILYAHENENSFRLHIGSVFLEGIWEMFERQIALATEH